MLSVIFQKTTEKTRVLKAVPFDPPCPSRVFRTQVAAPIAKLVQGHVTGTSSSNYGNFAEKRSAGPSALSPPRALPRRVASQVPGEVSQTAPLGWALGGHVRAAPAPVAGAGTWDPRPRPGSRFAASGRGRREGKGDVGVPAGPERPPPWPALAWSGLGSAVGSRPRLEAARVARPLRPGSAAHRKPAPANVRPFYNPLVTHNRPGAVSVKPPSSPPFCLFLEPTA